MKKRLFDPVKNPSRKKPFLLRINNIINGKVVTPCAISILISLKANIQHTSIDTNGDQVNTLKLYFMHFFPEATKVNGWEKIWDHEMEYMKKLLGQLPTGNNIRLLNYMLNFVIERDQYSPPSLTTISNGNTMLLPNSQAVENYLQVIARHFDIRLPDNWKARLNQVKHDYATRLRQNGNPPIVHQQNLLPPPVRVVSESLVPPLMYIPRPRPILQLTPVPHVPSPQLWRQSLDDESPKHVSTSDLEPPSIKRQKIKNSKCSIGFITHQETSLY